MGNCYAFLRLNGGSCLRANENVLQVVKIDGKILEFRAPLVVKDVLAKFPGSAGICLSKTVQQQQQLPLNYELKMGKVYYILPSSSVDDDPVGAPRPPESSNSSMATADMKQTGGVKRIKIVITKQELQQLLTKHLWLRRFFQGFRKGTILVILLQLLEIGSQSSNLSLKKTSS